MRARLGLLVVTAIIACGGPEPFTVLHVKDVAARLAAPGARPTLVDANGADFRTQEGIIPGAILLSSYKTYDAAKELPAAKDAPLVFYCASTY
jgi:hypothetical protein